MNEVLERVGPARAWAALVGTLVALIALAAVAFPQRVYVEIIWHYYWGPVVADAYGWGCVAWAEGAQVQCADVPDGVDPGPTASPGYTFQSYAGYIPTLLIFAIGIVFILRRLDLQRYRAAFFALFPFMLFGGALRVVEDANVAAFRETGELAISLPYSGFLISPLIYFTVTGIVLGALVVSVWLERRGTVSGFEYPLAAIGTVALTSTVGYLSYLALFEPYATFYFGILAVTLIGSTLITGLVWLAIGAFAPDINKGTETMGIVVIWAHTVDGVANVIGLDWATSFGHSSNLVPKHPVNEWIVNTTGSLLPASVVEVTGAAWPFLLVKVVAAVIIIWAFDESIFEESPRFAFILMVTVVAVGLGPGTRDMLRAVFGV